MQLTINKTTLANAVATVGKIIESRNTIPVLSHVRLVASDGTLEVTATDLDIIATTRVEADVPVAGSVCVEAKLIGDIAKKAAGDITMTLDGDKLTVKSGRSRFSLATLPASDFPTFGDDNYDAEFELDIAALFAPVAFAAGVRDSREMLNGVYFHNLNGKACTAATDGHRLARYVGPDAPEFKGVILSNKSVAALPKGVATVSVSEEKMRISTPDLTITTKLLAYNYVDYERVIPTYNDKVFTVDRAEMMSAAERVVSVATDKVRAVKLSLSPGALSFAARSEIGEAVDEVAAKYSGEPTEVGINSAYLRDMFSVLPDGPVTIKVSGPMSPMNVSGGIEGWDGVLMPMKV
jgi:DNA polymerase-3 subunit beta